MMRSDFSLNNNNKPAKLYSNIYSVYCTAENRQHAVEEVFTVYSSI